VKVLGAVVILGRCLTLKQNGERKATTKVMNASLKESGTLHVPKDVFEQVVNLAER
jgi:hypothetical protein